MYSAYVESGAQRAFDDARLRAIDDALMKVRRVWDAPAGVPHEGGVVEGSTLLISIAVADGGDVDVTAVARALNVTHSTASRLVDRAVRAGMVLRERSGGGRRVLLGLTPAGERLVAAARRFRGTRLAMQLAAWTDRDLARLATLLGRLADDLTAPGPLPE